MAGTTRCRYIRGESFQTVSGRSADSSFCGVLASHNASWDQFFTCGNHIVNGTFVTNKEDKVHSYQTVFIFACENANIWGPERQSHMYNQAIVWDDWAQWLMHKPRDDDQNITLRRSNPHSGKWFGFEVRHKPVTGLASFIGKTA